MATIGILGMGSMGQAMYQSLQQSKLFDELLVYDRNADKLEIAEPHQRCEGMTALVENTSILILAVKPQGFNELTLDSYSGVLISILSGTSIQQIKEKIAAPNVVRVMPNLALQVGKGMSLWYCADSLPDKTTVQKVLRCFGTELEMPSEEVLDQATGISGSGPAYFYYFTELLASNAEALGLSKENALQLAQQTFIGSAVLLEKSVKTPQELREAVTSKGGVTFAALEVLRESWPTTVEKALKSAAKRTFELRDGE